MMDNKRLIVKLKKRMCGYPPETQGTIVGYSNPAGVYSETKAIVLIEDKLVEIPLGTLVVVNAEDFVHQQRV